MTRTPEGHRLRLRARLLGAGPDALADHELIEMVLFIALPRRDTKPIARSLLARFGSFAAVISAPLPELHAIDGLGEGGIAALKLVRAAALCLAQGELTDQPVISSRANLMDYLNAQHGPEKVEQFHILFLNSRNRLLADETQVDGTVSHLHPREVVKRALELHAIGLVLVHNNPNGDLPPSRADLDMTQKIQAAARALSIVLHDHVVIGNGRWLSFRQEGLL